MHYFHTHHLDTHSGWKATFLVVFKHCGGYTHLSVLSFANTQDTLENIFQGWAESEKHSVAGGSML